METSGAVIDVAFEAHPKSAPMDWNIVGACVFYGSILTASIVVFCRGRAPWRRKLNALCLLIPVVIAATSFLGVAAFAMSGTVGLIGGGFLGAFWSMCGVLLIASTGSASGRGVNGHAP
jgi:hypothetical protein